MGWNKGYAIFEATAIGAYDLGKLDKDLLTVLMKPYRGSDIDRGGSKNLQTRDGKSVEQVVVETWGLEMPAAPALPYKQARDEWDEYCDTLNEQMRIVTDHFGWHD